MITLASAVSAALSKNEHGFAIVYELSADVTTGSEVVTDPGVELWDDANTPTAPWFDTTTGGALNRDSVDVHAGTYACRGDKTSAANLKLWQENRKLNRGKWYHFTVWTKASGGLTDLVLRLRNQNTGYSYDLATEAWVSGVQTIALKVGSTYAVTDFWFLVDDATGIPTHSYGIEFISATAASGSFWVDDVSVWGPYDQKQETRYLATHDLTWGGNTYEALVTGVSDLDEKMESPFSELTVKFSNVTNALRSLVEPTDVLYRRRLIQRLLVMDSAGGFETSSHVFFDGLCLRAAKITETTIEVKAQSPTSGAGMQIPFRRLKLWCPARYRDGVDCLAAAVTTTTGSGTSTAVTVADETAFQSALDRHGSGNVLVDVGDDTDQVLISTAAGVINLQAAITWTAGEDVFFAACPREHDDCSHRGVTENFLGFLSLDGFARRKHLEFVDWVRRGFVTPVTFFYMNPLETLGALKAEAPETAVLADLTGVVPVGYGRILTSGQVVERTFGRFAGQAQAALGLDHAVLMEGEIDSIAGFYASDEVGVDAFDTGGDKVFGVYYRPGGIGLDVVESAFAAQKLPQNRLPASLSITGQTYSRTAVVMAVRNWQDQEANFRYDIKATKVQLYDVTGSPVGARQWSELGPWHMLDQLISLRYGVGKYVGTADIDFAVLDATVTHCSTEIDSTEAHTTITVAKGVASSTYDVDDAMGFYRGQKVRLNGVAAGEVTEIVGRSQIVTDVAKVQAVDDVLRGRVPRYTSHGMFARADQATRQFSRLLRSFAGFITYDQGKIQIRVEKAESPVAHFGDDPAVVGEGYVIGRGSFKWIRGRDADKNTIRARFANASTDLGSDEVEIPQGRVATDQVREKRLSYPFVNTKDQAYRLANLAFKKLGTKLARIKAPPIAVAIQPGDVIKVTEAGVSAWSSNEVRVTRRKIIGYRKGKNDEMMCLVEVGHYDATDYDDIGPPRPSRPTVALPTLTLSVVSSANGKVNLKWARSASDVGDLHHYRVYRSLATPVLPNVNNLLQVTQQEEYTYDIADDEDGVTLYFLVRAKFTSGEIVGSNEVSALGNLGPDPTDTEDETGQNTGFDGGLDLPHQWEKLPLLGETDVSPNANTGTGYASPANAYDGNTATRASSSATVGTPDDLILTLPGAGTVDGYWKVTHSQAVQKIGSAGQQRVYWSNDDGSTWNEFAASGTSKVVSTSPTINGTRQSGASRLKVRFLTTASQSGVAAYAGHAFEAVWVEAGSTSGGGVIIGGGEAIIYGDGAAVYGELRRPWPGTDGDPSKIIANGSFWTAQIKYRTGGTPTFDLEFFLYRPEADTYYPLVTVAKANIVSAWHEEAGLWQAPATLQGPFLWGCRTRSPFAHAVVVTEIFLTPGKQLHLFGQHIDEPKKDPTNAIGTHDGFPRGAWVAGNQKRTTVST